MSREPRISRERRPRARGRCAAAVASAVALLAATAAACAGPATASGAHVPAVLRLRPGGAGYVVARRLPPGAPGTLVAARRVAGPDRTLGSGQRWQVLYASSDLAGRTIPVSGLVLLPPGRPPAGGWPLVAWSHGTTGMATRCAPSIAPELSHDPSAVGEVRHLLATRHAVVASDYPGLGTAGVHPYLVGRANADAVIDSVTAAHALFPSALTRSWATVGHSEGGQTALFVAQDAARRAPRWDYRGTVALAPASSLELLVPLAQDFGDPVDQAYALYALAGLATIDPSVHLDRLVAPAALPVLAELSRGCVDEVTNDLAARHITTLFTASGSELAALGSEIAAHGDPDRAPAPQPILIAQGTADLDVPPAATDGLVQRLCALGDRVEYRHYPGLDHEGVVGASQPVADAWLADRFAGRPVPGGCTTDGAAGPGGVSG